MSLPHEARSLLEMGPSFSPSQPISKLTLRKIACSLHELQDQLRRKAKLEELNNNEQHDLGALPPSPFPRAFFRQQDPNSEVDNKFRVFSDETLRILNHYRTKKFCSNLSAVQKCGMQQVKELISSKTIRLSISDKGGEFVVIPRQLDVAITEKHLQDVSLYRPSSEGEFRRQYRKLNREWVRVAKAEIIDYF